MASDQISNLIPIFFPNPFIFCTNLLSLQAQIISTCILSIASPFFSIISLVFDFFFHRPLAHDFKQDHHDSEPAAANSTVARGGGGSGSLLLGRIAMGLLAAAYVCMVLMVVMGVAAVLGVGLVRAWAEEPVYVSGGLQFDYAEAHPTAVFYFKNAAAAAAAAAAGGGVPVAHTLSVSLLLLMPESDYNRDLGIFQLTAELISLQGDLVAKSSHPCMMQFRSWPIRLTRTFLMSVPLLLGITTETQTITFPILRHKETSYPRTEYIRITLIPRAGTASLPQFYNAQVVMKSRPPWTKEFVYRWRLTFCVWTTLYIFTLLVMVLVFFLKPLIFPVMATPFAKKYKQDYSLLVSPVPMTTRPRDEEREVSESVKRWQHSRSKRKAAILHGVMPESHESESTVRSSATSITITTPGVSFQEGSGDSESVCFRGEE